MTAARRFPAIRVVSVGALLVSIYAVEWLIAGSYLFPRNPRLASLAITLDLTVFVPLLCYLLVIRPLRLPAISVIPVFLLSLAGAAAVLPEEHQEFLGLATSLAIPAELLALAYVGVRAAREVRRSRTEAAGGVERADFLERVRAILRSVIPVRVAADAAAHEAVFLYYAFFSWRSAPDVQPGEIGFTYHRKNGFVGMLVALMLVATVEMLAVHFLIERWSATAAWLLTAVSLYGMSWLIGLGQSVRLRPLLLTDAALHVRFGLVWSARIPLDQIAGVRPPGRDAVGRREPDLLNAVMLGDPQLMLELREPVEVEGLYGYRKRGVRRIGLAVDDRARLEAELTARLSP